MLIIKENNIYNNNVNIYTISSFQILQYYKIEYHHKKLDYYIDPMYTPKGPLKLKFINR